MFLLFSKKWSIMQQRVMVSIFYNEIVTFQIRLMCIEKLSGTCESLGNLSVKLIGERQLILLHSIV